MLRDTNLFEWTRKRSEVWIGFTKINKTQIAERCSYCYSTKNKHLPVDIHLQRNCSLQHRITTCLHFNPHFFCILWFICFIRKLSIFAHRAIVHGMIHRAILFQFAPKQRVHAQSKSVAAILAEKYILRRRRHTLNVIKCTVVKTESITAEMSCLQIMKHMV